jgi:regulatory protein
MHAASASLLPWLFALDCGTKKAMVKGAVASVERGNREERQDVRRERRQRPPLDQPALQELAFGYVARFATSRAKLSSYLVRKLRERGWGGADEPDTAAVVDKAVELGFVDDASFAGMKAACLTRRGYGKGRVRMAAALRFAERRRVGPYAEVQADLPHRQRALAAMLRAGHPMDLARRIIAAPPGCFEGLSDER